MNEDMQVYIGVKIVTAKLMDLGDYNQYRGWLIPVDENPRREGYLVRYTNGYESWCPKDQFEEANRLTNGMTFGHAIEALKKGLKVARQGWNGKGMFLWLMQPAEVKREWMKESGLIEACGDNPSIKCLGSIRMLTAQKEVLTGWLASQSDILAEDWVVVD